MSNHSRFRRAWLWSAAALCAGLAAAPAPLTAQSEAAPDAIDIETQQFEDWTLRCEPESETQARTCRMDQRVAAQDGTRVLRVLAGRFGSEKILGAVIFVPIGVRLPPGLGIQVDDRRMRRYPFEICQPKNCQARVVLDGDLLEDFKAGLTGLVKFQTASGQVLNVPLSLKGFSAALQALP